MIYSTVASGLDYERVAVPSNFGLMNINSKII